MIGFGCAKKYYSNCDRYYYEVISKKVTQVLQGEHTQIRCKEQITMHWRLKTAFMIHFHNKIQLNKMWNQCSKLITIITNLEMDWFYMLVFCSISLVFLTIEISQVSSGINSWSYSNLSELTYLKFMLQYSHFRGLLLTL